MDRSLVLAYYMNGAVTDGKDLGGWTHGIDMTQQLQMWKPTIAFTPFAWVGARVFARSTSLALGLFFCVATLLWNWRNLRLRRGYDLGTVASSAIGLGNVVMLAACGVANDGRYLAVVLVCGMVSLLRTIRTVERRADALRADFL
jgi:hypothetical protein